MRAAGFVAGAFFARLFAGAFFAVPFLAVLSFVAFLAGCAAVFAGFSADSLRDRILDAGGPRMFRRQPIIDSEHRQIELAGDATFERLLHHADRVAHHTTPRPVDHRIELGPSAEAAD